MRHGNPVIREILSLRREKAHLCGYKEYPDYALRESMAENGENAIKFVNELLDKIKAPFFREMETLRSLKARLTGQENARLNPWDVAYYANLRAEEHFRLDQEELRRHFPLPRVLDGLFSLADAAVRHPREGDSDAAVPLRHPGRRIRRSRGSLASGRALFHD